MSSPHGSVIFSTRTRAYGWKDAVGFAAWSGTWRAVEREVREGVACLRLSRQQGEAPTRAQVAAAAREFRYPRGLLAREDLEDWLQRRSLGLDGWLSWIRRTVARQAVGAEGAARLPDPGVNDAELQELTWISAICSGQLETSVNELAARAAAQEALFDPDRPDGWPEEPWQRLDVALQRFRHQAVTEERLAQAVEARQLDWTSVRFRRVSLATEGAARELVLSATEAGNDLEAVARVAGVEPVLSRLLLSDADASLRASLLSAAPLELVGPMRVGASWEVIQIIEKAGPSPDDPQLRAHAERVVADLAVKHEVDDRIRWSEHL